MSRESSEQLVPNLSFHQLTMGQMEAVQYSSPLESPRYLREAPRNWARIAPAERTCVRSLQFGSFAEHGSQYVADAVAIAWSTTWAPGEATAGDPDAAPAAPCAGLQAPCKTGSGSSAGGAGGASCSCPRRPARSRRTAAAAAIPRNHQGRVTAGRGGTGGAEGTGRRKWREKSKGGKIPWPAGLAARARATLSDPPPRSTAR